MFNQSRSTIDQSNLQEAIDAASNATQKGGAQYFTPHSLIAHCHRVMKGAIPNYASLATVLDPQCGDGRLVAGNPFYYSHRYGIELDSRIEKPTPQFINANCVRVADALDDVFPGTVWGVVNCNTPFSHKFRKRDGTTIDSTLWTWNFATKHGTCGFFIAGDAQLKKLGIDQDPLVFDYEVDTTSFNISIPIGIAFWRKDKSIPPTGSAELVSRWAKVASIIDEERVTRPDFNIYLGDDGTLRTYLSIRNREKLKLDSDEIKRLASLNKAHPLSLTTERETRDLLKRFVNDGIYTVQPEAKAAIESALTEMHSAAVPILPVTDFEAVAYADEEQSLLCTHDYNDGMFFTAGRKYTITTGTYKFSEKFQRDKVGFDEVTGSTFRKKHDCSISGQDRYIMVTDNRGVAHQFMDRPSAEVKTQHLDTLLWSIFQKPTVLTVRDVMPAAVDKNLAVLRTCEMLSAFRYYPGQLEYLACVGVKDYGLVGGETGTGKTLMALSLIAMKAPSRALIIAPQGTMRSTKSEDEDEDEDEDGGETNVSQWLQEIHRFTPYLQIYELFSISDYTRIKALNNGVLPDGVYVTYYEAMFQNGGKETAPATWDDIRFVKECNTLLNTKNELAAHEDDETHGWARSVGKEQGDTGIRCIMQPCMSTLIGHEFDMVLADEAHKACNLNANLTQMLIRLQPHYRYALTATPIPNVISNLFSLMGWLCVPGWYKGNRRNVAWPYARNELSRFDNTFRSVERDFTAEAMKKSKDRNWSGKVEKSSPIISAPARLLKIVKPALAFISKKQCNPDYVEPTVIDVRVPPGREQAALYGHFLERGNIPAKHPLVAARKQSQYLRAICTDPAGFNHHTASSPRCRSNMNPKVLTVLQLIATMLKEGEQCVIVSARKGLTTTLADRVAEAGIPYARIDSTLPAERHSGQAQMFKEKRVPLMFMGMKCAAAYSFGSCKYLIIVGIEWSPGPLTQTKGRIDRVISVPGHTIYCVLVENTIEETQFDVSATKDDAATICLRGQRVPRDYKPVDGSEVLAMAYDRFDVSGATPEPECEEQWPKLRELLRSSHKV